MALAVIYIACPVTLSDFVRFKFEYSGWHAA